jgi:hypothetical protein
VLVLFKLRKAALHPAAGLLVAAGEDAACNWSAVSVGSFDAQGADLADGDNDMEQLALCLYIQETVTKVIGLVLYPIKQS